jgi:ketosteroid isomerase-like protein
MSQENVEIVRRLLAAWNRRDEELMRRHMTSDIEWAPVGPTQLEGELYRGEAEVSKAFEEVWDTWDRFQFQEAEVRDLVDSVVWLGRVQMQGKGSEVALDQEFACHFMLRDAEVARAEAFLSWAEALEAAGLRE